MDHFHYIENPSLRLKNDKEKTKKEKGHSHVWCSNMTNDTSLESSYTLLFEFPKTDAFLKSPGPCSFKYAKVFAKF